jgi:hypothetical protein
MCSGRNSGRDRKIMLNHWEPLSVACGFSLLKSHPQLYRSCTEFASSPRSGALLSVAWVAFVRGLHIWVAGALSRRAPMTLSVDQALDPSATSRSFNGILPIQGA